MARRQARTTGTTLWRRAVIADMRRQRQAFPTQLLTTHLEAAEAGAPVRVTAGRLFRGLWLIGERDTAELFTPAAGHGRSGFVLGADDVLTEE